MARNHADCGDPFTDGYALDEAALQDLVAFSIEAGATGLVGPANASEFSTLSDEERRRWIEIVVAAAAGRVPVVASVTSGHALPAVALAQFAQAAGADGIMSMPPHVLRVDQEGCYAFYQQLADAVEVPICVQNFDAPVGTPMSGELLGRMCRELAGVGYIKEETVPEPWQVSRTLALAGAACKGVLGGKGGVYLLDEYRRGACGNMPGCHVTDAMAAIWDALEAGDETTARARFYQLPAADELRAALRDCDLQVDSTKARVDSLDGLPGARAYPRRRRTDRDGDHLVRRRTAHEGVKWLPTNSALSAMAFALSSR